MSPLWYFLFAYNGTYPKKRFVLDVRISTQSEILIFFWCPRLREWLLKRLLSTSVSPRDFLFCYLTCRRSFPSMGSHFLRISAGRNLFIYLFVCIYLYLFIYLSGLGIRFSNCPWDYPAAFFLSGFLTFALSSLIMLQPPVAQGYTWPGCWHVRRHPICGEPALFCVPIDFESFHRPGRGAGHVWGWVWWISLSWRRTQALKKE